VGKLQVDVEADCIDLLSMSGHKMYGPKGCGCLFVRNKPQKIELTPVIDGGGHERGYRSGTLNVPGIVGVGMASEIAANEMPEEMKRLRALRDRLELGILSQVEGVFINGYVPDRLPHMTSLAFTGVEHDDLVSGLMGVAVSSRSACASSSLEPSHVLEALGQPDRAAWPSLRFALGRRNTADEVEQVIDRLVNAIGRKTSPVLPSPAVTPLQSALR
jgi:cysteine desulfurase